MKRTLIWTTAALLALSSLGMGLAEDKIKVVGSVPDFAAVAKEIGGDLVEVSFIARGYQDPHFVLPKPSYAQLLTEADLFITTGVDLEMWAPPLIDKARNPKILEGAVGYVSASAGMELLDVHAIGVDRSAGDIHVYGNPHFQTCPIRIRHAAGNIKIGLQKVDPQNSEAYERGYERFIARIDSAMYGPELVELIGGDLLGQMVMGGALFDFLENEEFDGEKLTEKLGGYLRAALPFRGIKIIAYHKNWDYFAANFGMSIIDYVEPKPGIPPTARHVKKIIDEIEQYDVSLMIVANYFEKNTPRRIEERTGVKALFLPISVTGEPGIDTMFQLWDYLIEKVNEATLGNR